jgi:hypothetical protein
MNEGGSCLRQLAGWMIYWAAGSSLSLDLDGTGEGRRPKEDHC